MVLFFLTSISLLWCYVFHMFQIWNHFYNRCFKILYRYLQHLIFISMLTYIGCIFSFVVFLVLDMRSIFLFYPGHFWYYETWSHLIFFFFFASNLLSRYSIRAACGGVYVQFPTWPHCNYLAKMDCWLTLPHCRWLG